MNIALINPSGSEFYIAVVKRHANDESFIAVGKRVATDGRLLSMGMAFEFPDQKQAEQKVRDLVKIKIKRREWVPIDLADLPPLVLKHLEVPPDLQVTPEELVMMLRDAQAERYVTLTDVSGMQDFFDPGVEYIGYVTNDSNIVKVFDKFGTLRDCFASRIRLIELTERAVEAKAQKVQRLAAQAEAVEKAKALAEKKLKAQNEKARK